MKRSSLATLLLSVAFAAMTPFSALAAVETPACTSIGNTATVDFKVGNVQDPTGASGVATPFIVGNKINFTVTNTDTLDVNVNQGATAKVLNFLIKNTGNANQKFKVTYATKANLTDNPYTFVLSTRLVDTDNFDMLNPGIDGVGTATITTGILAPNGEQVVTIVANTPLAVTPAIAGNSNEDVAVYALIAQAYKVDGTIEAEGDAGAITTASDTCSAAVVFADSNTDFGLLDTDAGGDSNGIESARGAFKVTASSTLKVEKSWEVYSDPINGTVPGAKAIPGAIVTYTIIITNESATTTTNSISMSDALNANLTFNPTFDDGTDSCVGTKGIVIGTTCETNALDSDDASFAGSTVSASIPSLAPSGVTTIKFQVTIN